MIDKPDQTLSIQYARYSDPSQGKGTSVARQFAKMDEEAARQGYNCVRQIVDAGRSAFHGHHISKGELGSLLEEIADGRYSNYVLQVENIDRISRQGHQAVLNLVQQITSSGVSIHTCDGDHLARHKPVELDQVILLVIKADLAKREGVKRSERAASSWKLRRSAAKDGKAIAGAGPIWLRREGDTYIPIAEFAAIARRIWELADEKSCGAHTIVRLLNEEGTPMFDTGKPWYQSRVDAILSGMEVIGYHQPRRRSDGKWRADGEPLKIYPPIIPHDLYQRVSSAASVRLKTHGGGKSKTIGNLLSGLCRCAHCGSSMRLAGSTNGGYLMCSGRSRALCDNRVAFRYRPLEKTVLQEFLHLALDDDAFSNRSETARLNHTIAERETAMQVATEKTRGLLELAAGGSKMAVQMALDSEGEVEKMEANLAALKMQREAARGRADAIEHIARIAAIRDRIGKCIDLRRKVLQAFNTVIQSVEFSSNGVVRLRLVGGIVEVFIDQFGTVLDGQAQLTMNDAILPKLGDALTIAVAKQVTSRFAAAYDGGDSSWAACSG